MSVRRELSPSQREFLRLVGQAAFSNPFSPQRDEADRGIIATAAGAAKCKARDDVLQVVCSRVNEHLSQLSGRDGLGLKDFSGEDRDLVWTAVLFKVFHEYAPAFDDFIEAQAAAEKESLTLPFAEKLMADLRPACHTEAEGARAVAVFFQLRRAHHFISRGLVGESSAMRELRKGLWNNVFSADSNLYVRFLWNRMEDFSTLLLGETGTGKGAAAEAVGRSGFIPFQPKTQKFAESFSGAFISINLSQFPESLIESELFGHRKGAFTGAVEEHQGVFSRCSPHGAIFLDEIGDVAVPIQLKLLNVLQGRAFSPVGGHEKQRFAGRVIAATNRPLQALRKAGQFRDDFFYRLSSDVLHIPSLRERLAEDPGELRRLVGHLLARMLGDVPESFFATVTARIEESVPRDYGWPGNVRELEQCIRRVILSGRYTPEPIAGAEDTDGILDEIRAGRLDAGGLLSRYCRLLHRELGTFERVARRMNLDPRTVKKYIEDGVPDVA